MAKLGVSSCSAAPAVEKPVDISSRRVLFASHSHPQLTKGGAELAAYELFAALRHRPEYKTWFLGCARTPANQKLGATISQPFSVQEYMYACGTFDWFKFSNADSNFPRVFRSLLELLQPQITHFHHYLNFGVEAFLHVRATLPNCRIVLTLHEYLAICHHYGQMITKQHHTLCYQAAPLRCSVCFNEISPSDFFLRKLYIRRFFDLVDHFIAPSNFLAERYVAWGVPIEKISVIENVIPRRADNNGAGFIGDQHGTLRVGFFGQISVLKGIGVLLDAAEILEKWNEARVILEIFGDYTGQPVEFQEHFLARLAKAGRNVIFHGPYEQNRVDRLMQEVDLVLTPSIWWENSPIVIQEALRNRRPIVCSDIGGMAEKVRDGLDGFHFPARNAIALASLLRQLTEQRARLIKVTETMQAPVAAHDSISRHERLYAALLA